MAKLHYLYDDHSKSLAGSFIYDPFFFYFYFPIEVGDIKMKVLQELIILDHSIHNCILY